MLYSHKPVNSKHTLFAFTLLQTYIKTNCIYNTNDIKKFATFTQSTDQGFVNLYRLYEGVLISP